MKKPKKKQNSKNNFCSCGYLLGKFLNENVIKILGPKGQEYEIGFNYIKVTCPKCHKKHYLESRELKRVQNYLDHLKKNKKLAKLALNSGEAEIRISTIKPLDEIGLKSFYFLEDRHKRILKTKLTEWQNKIYDCLSSMGLDSDIGDSEDWDRVTQTIANKLKISHSKVEKDIVKIQNKISEILHPS